MIEFLAHSNSIILMYIVNRLFLSPVNIPFLVIICSTISSVFKCFLNTYAYLGFIFYIVTKINAKNTDVCHKVLNLLQFLDI